MKYLIFSRSLNAGGAERQLVLLAKSLHQRGISVAVMAFYGNGPFRSDLKDAGIPVIDLKKSGRWDLAGFLLRTVKEIRKYSPDVIYTFIGAHLIASSLRPLIRNPAVVWGVRASNMDLSQYDWLSRLLDKISVWLSSSANAILCNSRAGLEYILMRGYRNTNFHVVENGVDIARFQKSTAKRASQRLEWGVSSSDFVFGVVARIDPMKDHSTFLKAAYRVSLKCPNARFVCVGGGDSVLQAKLQDLAKLLGLSGQVVWAGHSDDASADYSAFDAMVLSSITEGFPNVIVEAMACGLPVVATDVGDCRAIVGEYGWIVPKADPESLAQAMLEAASQAGNWPADSSRNHVAQNYSVDAMVEKTLHVLKAVNKP